MHKDKEIYQFRILDIDQKLSSFAVLFQLEFGWAKISSYQKIVPLP